MNYCGYCGTKLAHQRSFFKKTPYCPNKECKAKPRKSQKTIKVFTAFLLVFFLFECWSLVARTEDYATTFPIQFENPAVPVSNFAGVAVISNPTVADKILQQNHLTPMSVTPVTAADSTHDADRTATYALQATRSFLHQETPTPVVLLPQHLVGPSGGLMTTLAYLDQVTGGTLSGGKQWVGTGTISPKGQVGPIGMTKTKLEGAANDGYRTFFLPIQNVDEVSTYAHQLDVTLIPVSSLAQAVSYLCQNGGTGPACQHIPKTQEFTYELLP